MGALTAAAVTDPAASAAVIQLLKGLLKQLQGAGTGAAPVQLTGSYVGYSTDTKPTISNYTPGTEITFLELDTGDVYVYDGTDWVVLA